jgi:uncharacterized protein (TIGR03435 family)
MLRNYAWLALLLLLGGFPSDAQLLHPKEPMPSFEVATVNRFSPPPGPRPPEKVDPGAGPASPVSDRVGFTGEIRLLIESAYGLPNSSGHRIVGGPGWIRDQSERYRVTAKIAAGDYTAIQKMSVAEQRRQVSWMQQSLLADRFQFRAHFEIRELPGFALVVAKSASKMAPAETDAKSRLSLLQNGQEYEMTGIAVSVADLAQSPFLRIGERQIVDKTGLPGRFNFTLRFRANGNTEAGGTSDVPELSTALQEQLGLKLVPESGPGEVLVIDRIERPSGN